MFDGAIDNLIKEYASHKNLKFIFNKKVLKKDLSQYGDVIDYDGAGFSATLSVDRKVHTKIAGDVLAKFPVDDLDVSEVSLEDIIGNIFKS
ncbi:MAG: hypothetical protein Q9M91_08805 [Candidatus Dojkabacteria bacterium]|nr:hypothetical protein [Candidatus Dojkabacteria bacterium]